MSLALAATLFSVSLLTDLSAPPVRLSVAPASKCSLASLCAKLIAPVTVGTLFGNLGDGGSPLRARMQYPQATHWDGAILWIVDSGNAAVRAVLPPRQARDSVQLFLPDVDVIAPRAHSLCPRVVCGP